jgi:hypothetical protein
MPFTCGVGQGKLFTAREIKLNTTGAEFFNLGWANKSANGLVCSQCGYLHAFVTQIEYWKPEDGYPSPPAGTDRIRWAPRVRTFTTELHRRWANDVAISAVPGQRCSWEGLAAGSGRAKQYRRANDASGHSPQQAEQLRRASDATSHPGLLGPATSLTRARPGSANPTTSLTRARTPSNVRGSAMLPAELVRDIAGPRVLVVCRAGSGTGKKRQRRVNAVCWPKERSPMI